MKEQTISRDQSIKNKIKYDVCGHDVTLSQLDISQVPIVAEVALTETPRGTSLFVAPYKTCVNTELVLITSAI